VTFGAGAEPVGVGQAAALPGWVWSAGRRSGGRSKPRGRAVGSSGVAPGRVGLLAADYAE